MDHDSAMTETEVISGVFVCLRCAVKTWIRCSASESTESMVGRPLQVMTHDTISQHPEDCTLLKTWIAVCCCGVPSTLLHSSFLLSSRRLATQRLANINGVEDVTAARHMHGD